jgi:hypothetical protein
MSYNYRCSIHRRCGARRTLKKPIEQYVRRPHCLRCGMDSLKPVKERKRNTFRACYCDGYHYPHSKGSKWCRYSKSILTDDDLEERNCA